MLWVERDGTRTIAYERATRHCASRCVCASHACGTVRTCEAPLYCGAVALALAGVWLVVRVTAHVDILAGA